MEIIDYPLDKGNWHAEVEPKKYIVWHGTEGRTSLTPSKGKPGRATTSIDGWNDKANQVGATYLVDRDGKIYRTFKNDGEWISHLGLDDKIYNKTSVGIELANELGLKKAGEKYYAFTDPEKPLDENSVYVGPVLDQAWRSFNYWAQLDRLQIDRAIELTLDICQRHKIPKIFYYPSTTCNYPNCFKVAGIICHSNCRPDKSDIILEPWVWQKILQAGFQLVKADGSFVTSLDVAAQEDRGRLGFGTVKVEGLNVRSDPIEKPDNKLRTLKNGEVVEIFGNTREWCLISGHSQEWVAKRFLSNLPDFVAAS